MVREHECVHAPSGLGVVLALEHSDRLRRHDLGWKEGRGRVVGRQRRMELLGASAARGLARDTHRPGDGMQMHSCVRVARQRDARRITLAQSALV